MPASHERNPKRFQTSQNAGTSYCNGLADNGDWRGKFRTRTVTTHIRLWQFHAGHRPAWKRVRGMCPQMRESTYPVP